MNRLADFSWWLESWLDRQPKSIRIAAEAAILSACVALVIVTAALLMTTPGG